MEPLDKFIIPNVSTHKKRFIESSDNIICLYPSHFTWEDDSVVEYNPSTPKILQPTSGSNEEMYLPSQEDNIPREFYTTESLDENYKQEIIFCTVHKDDVKGFEIR